LASIESLTNEILYCVYHHDAYLQGTKEFFL
jgi:hypothetical protein